MDDYEHTPEGHVAVYCDAIKFSKSGLALICDFGDEEVFIPTSQIHDNSEVFEPGQSGYLVIPEWLAIDKEIV